MSIGRLSSFIRRLRGDMAASQRGGLSDAQLLDRWFMQRDEAAFEVLLWRHGPMILGVCRRVLNNDADVEDAFQAAFLLLVRKGAAIRRGESVAAWLYQTAYRVALRARQRSRQRSDREKAGVELLTGNASDDVLWRDVRPILDDEINRLPEKYRIPFIRCYLEGCTNEEAAIEMACPVGTIHSRLAWARERLRSRLTRRGVTLGAAGLSALLAHGASVPRALAETTLQAAFGYAAHSVTATGISAGAIALTKGVLRTMLLAKLKLGAAVVVALAFCGGIGGLTYYHMAETAACPPPGTPNPVAASSPAPQPVPPAQAVRTIKVPSQVDGTILFLATESKPGEVVPKDKKIVEKYWTLGISPAKEDKVPAVEDRLIVEDAPKGTISRKWRTADGLPAQRLRVGYVEKTYRKLTEGDKVEKGQLLAVVDTDLARDELGSKIAKIDAAQAELQTSTETKKEAETRYSRIRNANNHHPGTFAPEDESGALLTWRKYIQEEQQKAAQLVSAQREANAAITILKKHEIRAPVSGEIKVFRVQSGEAAKRLETVLEILSSDETKESNK